MHPLLVPRISTLTKQPKKKLPFLKYYGRGQSWAPFGKQNYPHIGARCWLWSKFFFFLMANVSQADQDALKAELKIAKVAISSLTTSVTLLLKKLKGDKAEALPARLVDHGAI